MKIKIICWNWYNTMLGRLAALFVESNPKLSTKLLYNKNFGVRLRLDEPHNLNEKLQKLKLFNYYNNPSITNCVDKYAVRKELSLKGMEHILPKLYGVYDDASQIDFEKLPDSFVIKCNHGCGYNVICKDKTKLNIQETKDLLNAWMMKDYWKDACEYQYRFIKKKIVVEEFLNGLNGDDVITYKFYCFNGKPKVVYVSFMGEDGEQDKYIDYFDMDFNHLNIALKGHGNYPGKVKKSARFEEMREVAGKLAAPFPFVRIDLYEAENGIYFSEFTFIPTGGLMAFEPMSVLDEWGEWLVI